MNKKNILMKITAIVVIASMLAGTAFTLLYYVFAR